MTWSSGRRLWTAVLETGVERGAGVGAASSMSWSRARALTTTFVVTTPAGAPLARSTLEHLVMIIAPTITYTPRAAAFRPFSSSCSGAFTPSGTIHRHQPVDDPGGAYRGV